MSFITHIFPLLSQYLTPKESDGVNQCPAGAEGRLIKDVVVDLHNKGQDKIIIAGPDRAEKTSMVFQAAVTAAAMGSKVIYICTHPLSRLPLPIHGMKCPEPTIMRNVDFLYFEDCKELVSWLANVQTRKKLPSYFVIEDILTYASQLNENDIEMGLAKLCALLSDSCSWISNHNESHSCDVLMTAPSRITSLEFVCTQFGFKMAQYKGPSSTDPISSISYQWKAGKITISFHKINNCLMIKDVFASEIT